MKKLTINLFLLGVILVVGFSGCKDDENPTIPEVDEMLARIAHTWTLQEVNKDDIDLTAAFPGMKLIIQDDRTFSMVNPVPPMWPAEGSFTLAELSNGRFQITRSDDVVIIVTSVSETTLVVELDYDATTSGGRSKSVSGNYEFTFVK